MVIVGIEIIKNILNKEFDKENSSKNYLDKHLLSNFQRKIRNFNFDNHFLETLLEDPKGIEILEIVDKSKDKEEFASNINEYLKTQKVNSFSEALLIGNVTGKYTIHNKCSRKLNTLNIDAFTKKNEDLLPFLREHFAEYVLSNNNRKNEFAKKEKINDHLSIKDLTKTISKKNLTKYFDLAVAGAIDPNSPETKITVFANYLLDTIGTYSRDDIKNNFKFVLYDLDNANKEKSLEERRKSFQAKKGLSASQMKKIDQVIVLKRRLLDMDNDQAFDLLVRLYNIKDSLVKNIDELEDIYLDYEVLYRQDIIDHLFVPQKDKTIVKNYKDIKPQLIHQFIRSPEKFRRSEYEKIISKVLAERPKTCTNIELTDEEKKRIKLLAKQVDANLDRYKTNCSISSEDMVYSDAKGLEHYVSDTSNQISAQLFASDNFIYGEPGIKGIGFNKETLSPEAIVLSSNEHRTTNKGLNNLEYDEKNEFKEMSAPYQELENAKLSEIVLLRRGPDFDTKASYVFAVVDSSHPIETRKIVSELENIRKKEGLKYVIYDKYQLRKSLDMLPSSPKKEKDEQIKRDYYSGKENKMKKMIDENNRLVEEQLEEQQKRNKEKEYEMEM